MAKRGRFQQGIFRPTNIQKFLNKEGFCIYRSSYELAFLRWCDANPNVIQYGGEGVVIPYICPLDNKLHKYYIDNKVLIKEGPNTVTTYLIEIKPFAQTQPPQPRKQRRARTVIYESAMYAKNTAKWDAAKQYCNSKGYKFALVTEKELFPSSTK